MIAAGFRAKFGPLIYGALEHQHETRWTNHDRAALQKEFSRLMCSNLMNLKQRELPPVAHLA